MAAAVNGILQAGTRAPSFALPRLHGGTVALPERAAKGLTLVAFYKDTCPTCRLTLPFVQRIHEQLAGSGGRVVAVSQDGMESTALYAKELGLTMPIAVDAEGWPVSVSYGLLAVPTLYLIARDGAIVRGLAGFNKEELLRMAGELAESVGAPAPALYLQGEEVPALKPG